MWQFILDWTVSSLPCLFPSAESLTGRGQYVKRIRYHGKGMFGVMKIVRCHYFVKLVEGPPPPPEPPRTGFDQAKEYVQQLRSRTLVNTLWQTFVTILVFLVWQCNYIKEQLKWCFSYIFGATAAGWCKSDHRGFSYLSSHRYGKISEKQQQMLLFLSYLDHSIQALPLDSQI